jgi:hypothetical protein
VLEEITGSKAYANLSGADFYTRGGIQFVCSLLLGGEHILVLHEAASYPSWKHAYVVYGPYNGISGIVGWKVGDPDGGVTKNVLIFNDADRYWLIQR